MLKKLIKLLSAAVMAMALAGTTLAAAEPKLHEAQFFGSPQTAPTVRVSPEGG